MDTSFSKTSEVLGAESSSLKLAEANSRVNITPVFANTHVSVLGSGNMGGAFARLMVRSALIDPHNLTIVGKQSGRSATLAQELSCQGADGDYSSVAQADVVLLTCKKRDLPDLLKHIGPQLRPDALVVSTVAGITLGDYREYISAGAIVTVIPNPALEYGKSLSIVQFENKGSLSLEKSKFIKTLLSNTGTIFESQSTDSVAAASAVSGCGPAFVAHQALRIENQTALPLKMVDHLISGSTMDGSHSSPMLQEAEERWHGWRISVMSGTRYLGFSQAEAETLFVGAVRGYLALRAEGLSPEQIIGKVATPGGTTEAAIRDAASLEGPGQEPVWAAIVADAANRMGALKRWGTSW